MTRARDNANLGAQAGSGLDASDLTTGALPVGVTGGSGLNALSASNLSAGTVPDARMPSLTGDITTVEGAVATTIAASVIGVKPHIIPDVLYPSSGNDLAGDALVATTDGPNGSTVASSKYGTVQASDGRMYYYTDIKGSKPIKDPRIGAHFGSQRHKIKSRQLLEQETATHGENIYSFDGREFFRGQCPTDTTYENTSNGQSVYFTETSNFIEFTGYFNAVNLLHKVQNLTRTLDIYVDGLQAHTALAMTGPVRAPTDGFDSPLGGRYVDASSVQNIDITSSSSLSSDTTLGIHTFKAKWVAGNQYIHGIELIAQDTTSTTTKSQIQIPSQNVVSYGKKFTVAGTPHYDPFNGFTNGDPSTTTPHSAVVDTATSLGLSAWYSEGYYHSVYYRPYNGGRVVKWVDSSGTIKTSVNMMPFNATSISNSNINKKENAGATNNDPTPSFIAGAIDHSQAEVAKTFHWREFGNGNANNGVTGIMAANAVQGGDYADASMLPSDQVGSLVPDDIAYVMDDGLTSFSAGNCKVSGVDGVPVPIYNSIMPSTDGDFWYFTFIGTGIQYHSGASSWTGQPIAQNLPYGTHILKVARDADSTADITIDGVTFSDVANSNYGMLRDDITIFQPKMPPIPEDAVVIADYMLMADFVPQGAAGEEYISKGTRRQNISRDVFFDADFFYSLVYQHASSAKAPVIDLNLPAMNDTTMTMRIPSFGTNYVHMGYQNDTRSKLFIDTTDNDSSATKDNTASYGSYAYLTSSLTLGIYKFGANAANGQTGNTTSFDIATPTHTSSHYQAFEGPYLHELVGGDRNMEQNNLIVTPDGKTWDEVTRDTSYIGNCVVTLSSTTSGDQMGGFGQDTTTVFDEARGNATVPFNRFVKNSWVLAFNRVICLEAGEYRIEAPVLTAIMARVAIKINNTTIMLTSLADTFGDETRSNGLMISHAFKRGDYVQIGGGNWQNMEKSQFRIYKSI